MKTQIALACSLAALMGSPALATDLFGNSSKDTPAMAEKARSWTGPWIGIAGGYTFFNSELDYFKDHIGENDIRTNSAHANVNGLGAEGFFGELQAGYDLQVGSNVVVGLFGGVNMSDAEFEASAGQGPITSASATTDYEWGGVIGGRVGMLKGPNTLFYVAGGWAFAQLGDTVISKFGSDDVTIAGPDLSGWFAEVGAEHRIGGNLYLTVSGRYTDYGPQTLWANDDLIDPEKVDIDTDNLTVMVGLKAKLGGFGN